MDDQRPEDATKLAAFPRHSVMPRVCVADARQQMRTFLAETLEDLGCVTRECVHVAELSAELGTRPPDLVVIGSSAGGIEACEMVELLAAKGFGGKVLVLGPRASPMVTAIQELGAKLGLAMLPLLPTPFSQGDLRGCTSCRSNRWQSIWWTRPRRCTRALSNFGISPRSICARSP
jgi:CheY-like chemotaxis protein